MELCTHAGVKVSILIVTTFLKKSFYSILILHLLNKDKIKHELLEGITGFMISLRDNAVYFCCFSDIKGEHDVIVNY